MSEHRQSDYSIVAVRQEIEAQAHSERLGRALDIATTRLAWCLQNYPEVAKAYSAVWREA